MRVVEYKIILDINSKDHSFTGSEKIILEGNNEKLFLNSADLEIETIKAEGDSIPYSLDRKTQVINTDFVIKGKAEVEVEFSGKASESLMGLYRARADSGEILTTQFAPSDARRMFPCIDDPSYKAEFSLTLKIDRELDAISNMPPREEGEEGGKKVVEFARTPRMSTYLLYAGVGKFDYMKGDYNGKDVVLTAAKDRISETDYPIQIAKKSLAIYERYFDIDYALPKLNLISVPEFALGAMENWGAITFREILLTVSEKTGARTLKSVAGVIAHELAHQWFGNLVTMKWWNDLWLNESFATFMSSKIINEINPEWNVWGDFLLNETRDAMWGDSLRGSHPIDVEVRDTSEIAQIFDEISYGKGGSILRMIESYVGHDNFRDGIRKYLKDHSYGNATGSDLWKSIEEISKQPVSRIMEAWITKQGYPVIHATKSGNRIKLSQEQFLLSGNSTGEIWPIPLTVVRSGKVESVLMDSQEMEIEAGDFVKLNSSQTGFYRTLYDKTLFDQVISHLEGMNGLEKWGIVNDLYNFALSGQITLDEYLVRVAAFSEETEHLVVEEISEQLLEMHLAVPGNTVLSDFAVEFTRIHLEKLGEFSKGEHPNVSILRGSLSRNLAILDKNYASDLSGRFSSYDKENSDLKGGIAIAYAISENSFRVLSEKLLSVRADEERVRLLSAMGWLQDKSQLQEVLGLIKQGKIKKQDTARFYTNAAINPASKEFLLENLSFAVNEVYSSFAGMGMTGKIVEAVIPGLALYDRGKLLKTLDGMKIDEIERGKIKGMEIADIFLEFRKRSLQK